MKNQRTVLSCPPAVKQTRRQKAALYQKAREAVFRLFIYDFHPAIIYQMQVVLSIDISETRPSTPPAVLLLALNIRKSP
jgi:hypothetical protein